jgi:hypothetical protein
VRDNLSAAREANPSYELHVVGFSLGGGAAAVLAGLLDGTINAEDPQLAACVGMVSQRTVCVRVCPSLLTNLCPSSHRIAGARQRDGRGVRPTALPLQGRRGSPKIRHLLRAW